MSRTQATNGTMGVKTLALCPVGIGNYIMVTPALERLNAAIGAGNLHLLALKSGVRQLAEASGLFGRVHYLDPDSSGTLASAAALIRIRREKYDRSISLCPTADKRFAMAAQVIGAKTRYGLRYPAGNAWPGAQTHLVTLDANLHDTDQNIALVEYMLGKKTDGARRLTLPLSDACRPKAQLTTPYCVCHPGSSVERGMKEKRLPAAAFAQLIRLIHEQYGIVSCLVGGARESDLCNSIHSLCPQASIVCRSDSLGELAAVVSGALFYVGNDSGVMHISSALGKKCIAFFGPTDDKRNGPYFEGIGTAATSPHLVVRRTELACSPCWTARTLGANPPCIYGDTRCLTQLRIEKEWPAISRFIQPIALAAAGGGCAGES